MAGRFKTIICNALGIVEYRLEGYDDNFDFVSTRGVSLLVFILCLLNQLSYALISAPALWVKVLFGVIGAFAYLRFLNKLSYESIVVFKNKAIQFETRWRFFKSEQRYRLKDLAAVYIQEMNGKYALVFVATDGEEIARPFRFTKPTPNTLVEVYGHVNSAMPKNVQNMGMNVVTEPCDGLTSIFMNIEGFVSREWSYHMAGIVHVFRSISDSCQAVFDFLIPD